MKSPIKDMCLIAVFVALIAVMSQIAIPLPTGVPLVLQTFAVMLTGSVLGARKATAALCVYLLLGAAGVPVFTLAGGASGFHRIIGPWGGYLMSYPFVAFTVGLGADSRKRVLLPISLAAGIIINLSLGTFWYWITSTEIAFKGAFFAAFVPFILPEIIKAVMAFTVSRAVKRVLIKII